MLWYFYIYFVIRSDVKQNQSVSGRRLIYFCGDEGVIDNEVLRGVI